MRAKILLYAAAVAMMAGNAACSKNDEEPSGPYNGGGAVPDPEGTVLVSIRNDNNGGSWVNLPAVGEIKIDKSDNFIAYSGSVEFCSIGQVNGLGNIRVAPESGWASKVAVLKGCGYLARKYNVDEMDYTYSRLYVTDYIESVGGGVMGAYVKYQSPFAPDNVVMVDKSDFIARFPDLNFRKFLLDRFDRNGDRIIDSNESDEVTEIIYPGVCNFHGINFFQNLRKFECGKDGVNTLLTYGERLTLSSLDLSGNIKLEEVIIRGTKLESLPLSHPFLRVLDCSCNLLHELDLSECPALKSLNCSKNFCNYDHKTYGISSLNIAHNVELEYLDCSYNNFWETLPDLSNHPMLYHLDCESAATLNPDNKRIIDVSNCPELSHLNCSSCRILSLDVSRNPKLRFLDCSNNSGGIPTLDLSKNKVLNNLKCLGIEIKELDVSNNLSLIYLYISHPCKTIWLKYGQQIEQMIIPNDIEIKYK